MTEDFGGLPSAGSSFGKLILRQAQDDRGLRRASFDKLRMTEDFGGLPSTSSG